MPPPERRRVALPPWASWIGTPDYDADGVPRYARWELHADAAVHASALAWAFVSGSALLLENAHWRRVVFTCVTVAMFVTSSLYNLVGCGHRIAAEPFRRLDQVRGAAPQGASGPLNPGFGGLWPPLINPHIF
jgi:hypothetical protein